ncbi:Carboxylesterase 5A [Plecturocebus cupreus]
MMKFWANFARTGNPNGDDLPLWPAYNLAEQYLQLDLNMSLRQRLREQRVQFWTSTIPRSCLPPTRSTVLFPP